MSYFVFTVPSSHEKVMKNLTAYRGPDTCGGKKMCSIFWDFHILQVILVKQRSVIKFSVGLNSSDQ